MTDRSHRILKCLDCGKERNVAYFRGKPQSLRCRSCAARRTNAIKDYSHFKRGKDCKSWKGGRWIDPDGYAHIWLDHTSPYYPMAAKNHHVPEHRLMMAIHLGRCLTKQEHVHHKNGIKDDNRIENLELMSQADHNVLQKFCFNCGLRKEIRLLRWQIREQTEQIKNLTLKLAGL